MPTEAERPTLKQIRCFEKSVILFYLTKQQAKRLAANLPSQHIQALAERGFFTEETNVDGRTIRVEFGFHISNYHEPDIRMRVPQRPSPIPLTFVSAEEDPVFALIVLWLMWKRCPLAFLLTPCDRNEYAHHLLSRKEQDKIFLLLHGKHQPVYNILAEYFNSKGKP